MLKTKTNRAVYLNHLSGVGILASASSSAVRTRKFQLEERGVTGTTLESEQDQRVVKVSAPGLFASIRNILPTPAWDFVFADHEFHRLPDPLGALMDWAGALKSFGHIVLTLPIYEQSPEALRPVTDISHLVSDHKNGTETACDEHILAHAWANDTALFPNPDEIIVVLEDMWARQIYDMDERSNSFIKSAGNRVAIEELKIKAKSTPIVHHVFNLPLLLSAVTWINNNTKHRLIPIDLGLSKGRLSELVLVLQNHSPDFAATAEGQAMIQSQGRTFLRIMQGEAWVAQEIAALRGMLE